MPFPPSALALHIVLTHFSLPPSSCGCEHMVRFRYHFLASPVLLLIRSVFDFHVSGLGRFRALRRLLTPTASAHESGPWSQCCSHIPSPD